MRTEQRLKGFSVSAEGLVLAKSIQRGGYGFYLKEKQFSKVDPSKILMISLFSMHKFNVYSNPNI